MKAPFTEPQVKCLLTQLFHGMAHLHSRYLVHRDIKVWWIFATTILQTCRFQIYFSVAICRFAWSSICWGLRPRIFGLDCRNYLLWKISNWWSNPTITLKQFSRKDHKNALNCSTQCFFMTQSKRANFFLTFTKTSSGREQPQSNAWMRNISNVLHCLATHRWCLPWVD